MSTRVIIDYEADNNKGKAVVLYNSTDEQFEIEYFDGKGQRFFSEEFPNKSLHYVEDAAQNWALGIKKLGETI